MEVVELEKVIAKESVQKYDKDSRARGNVVMVVVVWWKWRR